MCVCRVGWIVNMAFHGDTLMWLASGTLSKAWFSRAVSTQVIASSLLREMKACRDRWVTGNFHLWVITCLLIMVECIVCLESQSDFGNFKGGQVSSIQPQVLSFPCPK